MGKVKNFARFYACLKTVQTVDKEDLKESLVSQFTSGRTTSLRDMSQGEYDAMCNSIDPKMAQSLKDKAAIKAQRSVVLRRMQKLGVDTADWNAVDKFCLDNRIAGKVFYKLTIDELKAMVPKLIAIAKKPRKIKESIEADNAKSDTIVITDTQIDYLMRVSPGNQILN
ncbi:MAG: hypothetical protein R3Y50_08015 [Rikenellaceae bacterium]